MNYIVEGTGETLVFIHGLSDSLVYWELITADLKDDFQVLRIDLRGHGESELGNDEITIDLYVNDLINLLNELNINKVNLIGFSLGGAVALDFAINYPDKVSSIVLMSSFAKADEHSTSVLNQFKNALNNSFEDFFDLILPMTLCPNVIDDNKQEIETLKEIASQNSNVDAFIKAVDACLSFDVEDNLSQIEVPTLILAGQYDEISPLNTQKILQEKIDNSELIVLDNTKHNLLVGKNNLKILNILKNFYKKNKE